MRAERLSIGGFLIRAEFRIVLLIGWVVFLAATLRALDEG